MKKGEFHLPIAVWTVWALSALSALTHTAALEANASGTHFNFFHAFSTKVSASPSSPVVDTVRAEQATLLDAKPQVIVTTTPDTTAARNTSDSQPAADELDGELKQIYTFTGNKRVGFASSQWQIEPDTPSRNGSVWTRLKGSNATALGVCVVVVEETSTNSQSLVAITADLNNFCATGDIVLLGFTSPLSDDLAQYLEAKITINGQYAPRLMTESVTLGEQAQNAQLDVVAAKNRLFVAYPAATAGCLEAAGGITVAAEQLTTQRVDLCFGEGCSTCGQSAVDTHGGSPVKRGLVVLLSCGSFLIGCAIVFYVLFRKQFFMPSDATKPEKDLTTNLAYVLRM